MRFLLTLVFAAALHAQAPIVARFTSGALHCGALKYKETAVQAYCFIADPAGGWILKRNGIYELPAGGGGTAFLEYGPDVVLWHFTYKEDGTLAYKVIGGALEPGEIAGMVSDKLANIQEAGFAEVTRVALPAEASGFQILGRLVTFTTAAEGTL